MKIKKDKIFTVLIIFSIFSIIFLSCNLNKTNAYTVEIAIYSGTNEQAVSIVALHPSGSADISAVGEAFACTATGYVSTLRVNAAVGNELVGGSIQAEIYALSGSYGTTAIPTGDALAQSSIITQSSISSSESYLDFNFNRTVQLNSGTNYVWIIKSISGNYNGTVQRGVHIYFDNSGPTYGGNYVKYVSGGWTYATTYDAYFFLYGTNDAAEPTPTPTPTPTPANFTQYSYIISPLPNFTIYNFMTSAHINQSENYVYTGTLTSQTIPYGTATYSVYTTSILNGSLDNDTIRSSIGSDLGLLGSESLTLNTSGTFSLNGNGQFNFNILSNYEYNSICKYQGYKINGTIPSTGETFNNYLIIEAVEPDSDSLITVYLTGGVSTNMLLSTQSNFNQISYNTQYNTSGFIYLNGIPYTDNDTVIIYSTIISINQITVKNLPFSNQLDLDLTNGQFTFLITPQIYNAIPSYQGIKVYQPTLGIYSTYWIEYIGLGTSVFPTPYPTSSSSVINPTATTSLDLTQFAVMFFLLVVPSLLLAGMCYELASKTTLNISPIIGFFLGLCVMTPIGYLTPYNGAPLVPLWMLFTLVLAEVITGVLIVKSMFHNGGLPN